MTVSHLLNGLYKPSAVLVRHGHDNVSVSLSGKLTDVPLHRINREDDMTSGIELTREV